MLLQINTQGENTMKIKRLLAAILSGLMITSALSFTVNAQDANDQGQLTPEVTEPAHITAYREAGYDVVYVSTNGGGDGTTADSPKADLAAQIAANSTNSNTVVYAVVDNYYSTAGIAANGMGNGQKIIITSGDGTPLHLGGNLTFGQGKNGEITIDNIEIVYGGKYATDTKHTPTDIDNSERNISASGNKLVIGENVTLTPATTGEKTRTSALIVYPYSDGGTYSGNTAPASVEIYSGTNIYSRAAGYNGIGATVQGVKYVIGGDALLATLKPGGHTAAASGIVNASQLKIKGGIDVTIKENAVVDTFELNGNYIYSSDAVINVEGGTITKMGLFSQTAKNFTGSIPNTVVYHTGGTITEIGDGNEHAGTIRAYVVDTAKITTLPTIGEKAALTHIVKYDGDKGSVRVDTSASKLVITPNDGIKYIKLTNGDTVNSYKANGDAVQLASEFTADLLAGTTTVEFLEEATEIIDDYTVTFVNTKGEAPTPQTVQGYKDITLETLDDTTTFLFKGWSDGTKTYKDTYPVRGDITLTAVWEEIGSKIYISDDGNDNNNGLSADTPVLTMPKANTLLSADGKDTLVVVGGYTICKEQDKSYGKIETIGINKDKPITIMGATADVVFNMDRTWASGESTQNANWDDARVSMAGPVTFRTITLKGENNDGFLATNGHNFVIESDVTLLNGAKPVRVVSGSNKTNNIILNGGKTNINVAGTANSAVANDTNLTVNGGTVESIGLGKGHYGAPTYSGTFKVTVDSGFVTDITMQSDGTGAANQYKGLRYYTLNGGKVYGITTTGSATYLSGSSTQTPTYVPNRTGTTVFEINAAGVLDGNINLGKNKATVEVEGTTYAKDAAAVDDADRIILFNNNSYASYTYENLDTTAITVNVIGGALSADVTVAADYTTTLNGYTFKLADESYDRVTITPAGGTATTYTVAELNGKIGEDVLLEGTNKVEFFKYIPAANITFNANGGVWGEETEKSDKVLYDEIITIPANPVRAGHKFIGWALGNATEAYEFPAEFKASEELDGAVFNALWERAKVLYVDGTATQSGDGFTKDTPINSLADAIALVADTEATIVLVGDFTMSAHANYGTLNGGSITITSYDNNADTGAALVLANWCAYFLGTGSLKFENITIKNSHNQWDFIDFKGLSVEFGNGVNIPTGEIEGVKYYSIKTHAAGETNSNYTKDGVTYIPVGDKIVIRSGNVDLHLGGKGKGTIEPIDFEFLGGNSQITLGNDSISGQSYDESAGVLTDVKLLLDAAPKSFALGRVSEITGSYQFIANNGVTTAAPLEFVSGDFRYPINPTNKWIIHSAQGGRVDFTETAGTFNVTTEKTYIIVTDKATGEATRIRVADGVSGDAALFADGDAYTLTLDAGDYDIAYTDDGVKISVTFENGDADENYTIAKGETATYTGTVTAPAGYVFAGWENADGTVSFEGNTYTADTYFANGIVFTPVFEEDDTIPYYHANGVYNDKTGTFDVKVSIANGKFTAGTVGGIFEKDILEFTGYTLGSEIGNNIGTAPEIVSESMFDGQDNKFVLVWNAIAGKIDATANDVEIITFHFNVKDADKLVDENNTPVTFYHPTKAYEGYFDGTYYQASPAIATGDDEYAVNFVDVYEGEVGFEYAPTEPATITVKVTMTGKLGATVDNVAYLAYAKHGSDDYKFIALEDEGNTEAEITKVISDVFFVGEAYDFVVVKNGYVSSTVAYETVADGLIFETTLIGGDIKESFTGTDANAVDMDDFGDGKVTLSDFVRVVRAFDTETVSDEYASAVDINEDGTVDVTDLGIVKSSYGKNSSECQLIAGLNG